MYEPEKPIQVGIATVASRWSKKRPRDFAASIRYADDDDVSSDGSPRRLTRGLPTGLFGRSADSSAGAAESRDHLLGETVEICKLDVERSAERGRTDDAVEAGIALLDRL